MKINNLLRLLAFTAFATSAAQAGLFDLNYTGSFNSTTTLGGVALGADTPFSMVATFDGSPYYEQHAPNVPWTFYFHITAFSLTLGGNTYTKDNNGTFGVALSRYNSVTAVFIGDNGSCCGGISAEFDILANPSFDFTHPSPYNFVAYLDNPSGGLLLLNGVPGGLGFTGLGSTRPTASITAVAVPEPAEYAVVTGFAIGVFALVRRRKQVTCNG